jgi:hypothetical protein
MPIFKKIRSRKQLLPGLLLFLFVVSLLAGCGRGYVVDKKKNSVVYETWDEGRGKVILVLSNADAATFELMKLQGPPGFARDKNQVYLFGIPVTGAHPESFRRFKVPGEPHASHGANFYYYRDSERVFIYPYSLGAWINILPNSDPESFRIITNKIGWARDRMRVYLFEEGFVPQDIDSFEPLERVWSRDSKAYYWGAREVAGADRETFKIVASQPWFATDRHHLFWQGWTIDECDQKTFQATSLWTGHDREFSYQFTESDEKSTNLPTRQIKVEKLPLK